MKRGLAQKAKNYWVLALLLVIVPLLNVWLRSSEPNQIVLSIPLELRNSSKPWPPIELSTNSVEVTLVGEPEVIDGLGEGLVRAWVDLKNHQRGTSSIQVEVLCPNNVRIVKIDPPRVAFH